MTSNRGLQESLETYANPIDPNPEIAEHKKHRVRGTRVTQASSRGSWSKVDHPVLETPRFFLNSAVVVAFAYSPGFGVV